MVDEFREFPNRDVVATGLFVSALSVLRLGPRTHWLYRFRGTTIVKPGVY
jgi:hypothetical protein